LATQPAISERWFSRPVLLLRVNTSRSTPEQALAAFELLDELRAPRRHERGGDDTATSELTF
jgi:hypothetical protein